MKRCVCSASTWKANWDKGLVQCLNCYVKYTIKAFLKLKGLPVK